MTLRHDMSRVVTRVMTLHNDASHEACHNTHHDTHHGTCHDARDFVTEKLDIRLYPEGWLYIKVVYIKRYLGP